MGLVYSTNPNVKIGEDIPEVETLAPGSQKLIVAIDRSGRAGKQVTLVKGFVGRDSDLSELGKRLKTRLGVGGSAKDGLIIIQGDWRDKTVALLKELGYTLAKRGN